MGYPFEKQGIIITNAFQQIWMSHKPKKIWVDEGSVFYSRFTDI